MKLKAYGEHIIVLVDKEQTTFTNSCLVKPETVHEDAVGSGIVESIGWHHKTMKVVEKVISEIKPGDRVYFIKFLKETNTNKLLSSTIGDDRIIIEFKDVLGYEPMNQPNPEAEYAGVMQ